MNIPQLQVTTRPARFSLDVQKPVQEIEQPRADLSIEQPAAILEISTTRPQLSIDTTENRAEVDLKHIFRRIQENADYGMQKVKEGTVRRAEEGMQLMKIEDGATVADIAKQSANPPQPQLGITFVGDPMKVKIDVTPGRLDINAEPQKPIINSQINKPIHNYTPGKVTLVMEDYGSIEIDWKV